MDDDKKEEILRRFLTLQGFKEKDAFAVIRDNIVVLIVLGTAYITNLDKTGLGINCNMSIDGNIEDIKVEIMDCIRRVS